MSLRELVGVPESAAAAAAVGAEAMSEALAEALGGCVDPVPVMLSFEELFGCWGYSTNDGLSWSHLVEGSLDAATVVSRLRAVLDGGGDPQRWESEDDSGLAVLDAEIGVVCCHLDDGYSLTLVSHVSGSEAWRPRSIDAATS